MSTISATSTSALTSATVRVSVFRARWLAALVSTIGRWMQTVGAQWTICFRGTHDTPSPRIVVERLTAPVVGLRLGTAINFTEVVRRGIPCGRAGNAGSSYRGVVPP